MLNQSADRAASQPQGVHPQKPSGKCLHGFCGRELASQFWPPLTLSVSSVGRDVSRPSLPSEHMHVQPEPRVRANPGVSRCWEGLSLLQPAGFGNCRSFVSVFIETCWASCGIYHMAVCRRMQAFSKRSNLSLRQCWGDEVEMAPRTPENIAVIPEVGSCQRIGEGG